MLNACKSFVFAILIMAIGLVSCQKEEFIHEEDDISSFKSIEHDTIWSCQSISIIDIESVTMYPNGSIADVLDLNIAVATYVDGSTDFHLVSFDKEFEFHFYGVKVRDVQMNNEGHLKGFIEGCNVTHSGPFTCMDSPVITILEVVIEEEFIFFTVDHTMYRMNHLDPTSKISVLDESLRCLLGQ